MRLLQAVLLLVACMFLALPGSAWAAGPSYAFADCTGGAQTHTFVGTPLYTDSITVAPGSYFHTHGGAAITIWVEVTSNGGSTWDTAFTTSEATSTDHYFNGTYDFGAYRWVDGIRLRASAYISCTFHGLSTIQIHNDDDGDSVLNQNDNCIDVSNPSQTNTDVIVNPPGDALGDACDTDDDNDGVGDGPDNCQFVPNSTQDDRDSDGLGNECDDCTDFDADGYGEYPWDISGCTPSSSYDNCPDNSNIAQTNIDQAFDPLVNGVYPGDACDTCTDSDGDGFGNFGYQISTCTGSTVTADNCPGDSNIGQLNTDPGEDSPVGGVLPGDKCDTCTDSDEDGWGDGGFNADAEPLLYSTCANPTDIDNCTSVANPNQANTDFPNDAIGDACDTCTDRDDDGWGDGGFNGDGETLEISACPLSTTEPDNCVSLANPTQANTDDTFDAVGDRCDTCTDQDGDGWGDGGANSDGETLLLTDCPESDTVADNCTTLPNPGQINTDSLFDGLGDECDTCTDQDDDTWGDGGVNADGETLQLTDCGGSDTIVDNCSAVSNLNQGDWDSDLIGDVCDTCTDFDDDGWGDPAFDISGCPETDDINCEGAGDPDCDPFVDNCPDDSNPTQSDLDTDTIGDVCDACTDPDVDGYGTPGLAIAGCTGSSVVADNCPDDTNVDQADFDVDTVGDVCDTCTDFDDDGFGDPGYPDNTCPDDNCPADSNVGQADEDLDGVGDLCDTCTDSDDDGYGDPGFGFGGCAGSDTTPDNCVGVSNADQLDTDLDGMGDACDLDDDDDGHLDLDEIAVSMNPLDVDSDGDTIADWDETTDATAPEDTDEDTVIDSLDEDTDDDGLLDIDEAGDGDVDTVPVDTDDDGTPDFRDVDSDDDGVEDGIDNCHLVPNPDQLNTDGDEFGDDCEDDTDGDGVLDIDDNCLTISNIDQADDDGNGTGDACEGSKAYLAGPGCGCDATTGAGAGWAVLALLALVRRRRSDRAAGRRQHA